VVIIVILAYMTKERNSIDVKFIENNGVNIKSLITGSYVILNGGPVGITMIVKAVEDTVTFGMLEPLSSYTVSILSPDLSVVIAHGTFTTPMSSSSPVSLSN
jgi:hypothetical protein